MCSVYVPVCVSSSTGVTIQWEITAYTVSENSGTVQLMLLKEGFTDNNVSVEVTTVGSGATGKWSNKPSLFGDK